MGLLRRFWSWFDDLTGTSKLFGPPLFHHVPHARRSRWFYVFGSATLTAFIIQIITGTALSSAYVTSSGQAYESLRFITESRIGGVIRGIHYFGASAMVLLIGIHTIRVYLMGAYKYPRIMSWLSGAVLLALTLLMAFTGQLLRWDQVGFWTAVVASEQAGRTPFIGNWLGYFILAGDTVGGATLSRFFAAHVFFLPACMFALLALHLWLVIYNGISEPPQGGRLVNPRTYRRWYRALLEREGLPFWPYAAWRDVVAGVLLIVGVVALAITVGPPELGKPPDPTIIQASPRPDWYFMWYFALLSVIPKWTERWVIFLGPLVFWGILFILPFAAPRGERSPLRRPWSIMAVVFAFAMIGHFWTLGIVAPWSPRLAAPPLPAQVVGTTTGAVADGARVFYDKGCEFCHTVSGYGGLRGPYLTYAGDRMTEAQMTTRIFSGATNMPSYNGNLTMAQLKSLLAFLGSRRHRLPLVPIPAVP